MTKKAVFISSTYQDLLEHRRAVWDVLQKFDVDVRGMEQFGARKETPLQTCLAEVEQSDVYVGIVGFRLGSIDGQSGKSFTQLEYERAVELDKGVLIYLADERDSRVRVGDIDVDDQQREKLKAFKRTLRERHTVDSFVDAKDLSEKLARDFRRYFVEKKDKSLPSPTSEFEEAKDTLQKFFLLPTTETGTEIRLRVQFHDEPFAASRALCKPFLLTYGATIGVRITVIEPKKSKAQEFKYLYGTGQRAEQLITLSTQKQPVDLYAVLKFTDQDVPKIRAVLIGYTYYDVGDWDDDNEKYVAPEGYAALLFSKLASP